MNKFFFLMVLGIGNIMLVCCSILGKEVKQYGKGNDEVVISAGININSTSIDSITSAELFLNKASEIILPYSINSKEGINISEIQNGIYKGKQLMPLSTNYTNTIKKVAIKRYISDVLKKHYFFNVDVSSLLEGNHKQKYYALGKIIFTENNLASQIIYIEVITSGEVAKFVLMVNYDTSFKVYLHSALLAVSINSDSYIKLESNLFNEGNNICLIKQKYNVNEIEKNNTIEINKAFYYAPPAEGGPNPKDYIKYLH
jgi:hypothetical protein